MTSLLWLYGIGMATLVALYTAKRWGDKPTRTRWLIPEMKVGPNDRLVIRSRDTLDRNQISRLIQEWKAVWNDDSNQNVIVVDPCFELSVIRGKTEFVSVENPEVELGQPRPGYYDPANPDQTFEESLQPQDTTKQEQGRNDERKT